MLHKDGKSCCQIADRIGVAPSTVARNIKKLAQNPDVYAPIQRSGRPRLLSVHNERLLCREVISGKVPDATAAFKTVDPLRKVHTTRRAFVRIGLFGCRCHWSAVLTHSYAAKCLKWAKAHKAFEREVHAKFYRCIVFSDECWINLWGLDGTLYCSRGVKEAYLPRNVKPTKQQGGGGLMVWGCITQKGVGCLYCVEGTMNKEKYCEVLSDALIPSLRDACLKTSSVTFQHDGATSHTATITQSTLSSLKLDTMPWPPGSPDMNIIEHVWAILKQQIKKRRPYPCNMDQLWEAAQEEWYNIPKATIKKLYKSIPCRLDALISAKGWYTKY
jgi:hypothetical protein